MPDYHLPVMPAEVLDYLRPRSGAIIVDGTIGGGGHALEIVERILPGGRLIGIDRDEEALGAAAELLKDFSGNVTLKQGNFSDIEAIVLRLGIRAVDGVLLDLGLSSHQLDTPERGFSFKFDTPLDMRMDRDQSVTARDLVNSLSERHLAEILWNYGEEKWARRIAKFIVERRARKPIETTAELAEIVLAAIPSGARPENIHAATKTFQGLRIAVNKELEALQSGLDAAIRLLGKGGRLVVFSYHSLEDRMVKETFARHAGRCTCPSGLPICACGAEKRISILTRRPISPSETEVRANPRARSAKLRAVEKL